MCRPFKRGDGRHFDVQHAILDVGKYVDVLQLDGINGDRFNRDPSQQTDGADQLDGQFSLRLILRGLGKPGRRFFNRQ